MKLKFDNDGQCQFSGSTPIPVMLIEVADRVHQVVRLTIRGSRRDDDELVLRPGGATEAVKLSVSECARSAQIASAILTIGQPGQDVGSESVSSNSSKPDPRVSSILARTMFTITPSRIATGRLPIALVRELSEIYCDLRNEARFQVRDDPEGEIAKSLTLRDQTAELRRIVLTLETPEDPSSTCATRPTVSQSGVVIDEPGDAGPDAFDVTAIRTAVNRADIEPSHGPIESIIYMSPLQLRIMNALDRRFLASKELAKEAKIAPKKLWGGKGTNGLNELMRRGIVASHPGRGYYRLDRRPPGDFDAPEQE